MKLRLAASLILLSMACTLSGKDYSSLVNPFVGTDGHGHTFPAATLPFGMIQAGPDTRINGWDGCSGYHYSDSVILGFTHTHLSGTGCLDYGDILLMPVRNAKVSSRFSHSRETASPGYYQVWLEDQQVDVRISAGKRMAMHEYRYSGDDRRQIFVDLHHRDRLLACNIEKVGPNAIQGWRQSHSWAKSHDVYFYAEFSEDMVSEEIMDSASVYLHFPDSPDPLKVKIAISSVSCDNARLNLLAEKASGDWNFETLKAKAVDGWNDWLSRIDVKGTDEQMRTFYSALYHCAIHPSLYSDANGEYRGMDRKVHKAEGYDRYTVFSIWDVFRSCFPLYNMIAGDYMPDFLESMMSIYREGGILPKWELAGNETGTMIGFNSVSVIADAYAKGNLPLSRLEEFYEAMVATAERQGESGRLFAEYGYIPSDEDNESVSKTLEFSYDYWCIARIAKALGRDEDYARYIRMSQYWKNLFDAGSKFMRPREKGCWTDGFDPAIVTSHFTEANSWQYSFFVPQDIEGHMKAMGGRDAYASQLDALFAASHEGLELQLIDVTGLVGQYAHGNEPSHHVAFLYDYASQPWKTQKYTRQICSEFYNSTADGLCGNEDCGQMSAWYVLSALGLYCVTPGTTKVELTSPLFRKAVVKTGVGKLVIRTDHAEMPYIKSARLNGKVLQTAVTDYSELMRGRSRLEFTMSAEPTQWGCMPAEATSVEPGHIYNANFEENFGQKPQQDHDITLKVNCITPWHGQYNAGGPFGLVDGKRGKYNWRAGGWQGYRGDDMDVIIELPEQEDVSEVTVGFLQDMDNYIWMPKEMEVLVSTDGENFTSAGRRSSELPIDLEGVRIEDWTVSFEPTSARYVRIKACQFGTIPSWHRGYGDLPFIFTDEISIGTPAVNQ